MRGGFKVPSLRNVALTAPYEHSGQIQTLHAAGDFYNKVGGTYLLSEIYDLFKQDINGNTGAATNDTHRYAVINGVKLALPEIGADLTGVSAGGYRLPGTSISNTQDTNNTYDGLFAIWDAHNGAETGTGSSGVPPGWSNDSYVSATPFQSEHAFIRIYDGLIEPHANWGMNVALQVL